jgi:hypothetical protein
MLACIECGLRPKHKRYYRCRECMVWKWSLTSRKGLLKRQLWRERMRGYFR